MTRRRLGRKGQRPQPRGLPRQGRGGGGAAESVVLRRRRRTLEPNRVCAHVSPRSCTRVSAVGALPTDPTCEVPTAAGGCQ